MFKHISYLFSGQDRRLSLLLILLVSTGVLIANSFVTGPVFEPDESSYLARAAALAGFDNDMVGSFHSGYALLIFPAYLLGRNSAEVWAYIPILNSFLFLLSTLCLWHLAPLLGPRHSPRNQLGGTLITALYPMSVVAAGYALAHNALVPFYLLTLLILLKSTHGQLKNWLALGLVSGFLYWIHPTGLVPIVALILTTSYITYYRRCYVSFLALICSIAAMLLAYKFAVTPWFDEHMSISGMHTNKHYPGLSNLLTPLTSLSDFLDTLIRMAGQVLYLIIGTAGAAAVGAVELAKRAVDEARTATSSVDIQHRTAAVFLLLGMAGLIGSSSAMFVAHDAQRLDHWIYGRYIDEFIAPLLLIGLLSLSQKRLAWAIAAAIICLLPALIPLTSAFGAVPLNLSSLWQALLLQDMSPSAAVVIGIALAAALAALPIHIFKAALVAIFLVTCVVHMNWHIKLSTSLATGRTLTTDRIRDLYPPGTCIAFDDTDVPAGKWHLYRFVFWSALYDYHYIRQLPDDWVEKCNGPMFSYASELNPKGIDTYISYSGNTTRPSLWHKDPATANRAYPMKAGTMSGYMRGSLGQGWNYSKEKGQLWSEQLAYLTLPVPRECQAANCAVRLSVGAFQASESRPMRADIRSTNVADTALQSLVFRDNTPSELIIPLPRNKISIKLQIEVPDAVSTTSIRAGSIVTVTHGIALYSIDLLSPDTQASPPGD